MSFLRFTRSLGLSACVHPTYGARHSFHSSAKRSKSFKQLIWGAGFLVTAASIPLLSRTIRLDAEPLAVESNTESTSVSAFFESECNTYFL